MKENKLEEKKVEFLLQNLVKICCGQRFLETFGEKKHGWTILIENLW